MPDTLETPPVETEAPKKGFKEMFSEAMRPADNERREARGLPPKETPQEKKDEPKAPIQDKPASEAAVSLKVVDAKADDIDRPEDAEIESGKRNPKKDDFNHVKGKAKEYRGKYQETQAERDQIKKANEEYAKRIEALEKAPKPDAEKLTKLEAELLEHKRIVDAVMLDGSPEFTEKYGKRETEILSSALAGLAPEKADLIADLLRAKDSPETRRLLLEQMEDMDEIQKGDINSARREIKKITSEKIAELGSAKEHIQNIAKQRQAQAEAVQKQRQAVFEDAIAKASDKEKGMRPFQTLDGTDEAIKTHNQEVQERINLAKAVFDGSLNDQEKATMAQWAASAPVFMKDGAIKDARIKELEKTITALQAGNPNVTGGAKVNQGDAKLSFKDRVNNAVSGKTPLQFQRD